MRILHSKAITTAVFACLAFATAHAVPADPRLRTNIQEGGISLNYYVVGDEHGHMNITTDGMPLVFNQASKSFEYAIFEKGNIVSSGIIAKNPENRTAAEVAMLESINYEEAKKAIIYRIKETKAKASVEKTGNGIGKVNNYPTKGFRHSPVILIEFADMLFTSVDDAKSYYTEMLNSPGFDKNGATGSVRDYYTDNSDGQFDVEFDVYGPVQLSMPHHYYGISEAGAAAALSEACKLLDSEIDFSQYDMDNDGRVDNIFYFFAGYGEADSGNPDDIWPCSWDLLMAKDTVECDGKLIGSFACSNEIRYDPEAFTPRPTGIGTFVHEFGHVLGLPDMYDTAYSMFTFTSGYIDLMDMGSYLNDSNTPPNLSGYERYSLEWADPTVLDMDADSVIRLNSIKSNEIIRIATDNKNENFFIENRQQEGWDTYLPLHGMLVWHTDYDSLAFHGNIVNNDYTHPRVDLIEADNVLTTNTKQGDSFPGSEGVTTCTLTKWDGTEAMPYPDYITERDGVIMFIPGGVSFTPEKPQNLKADNIGTRNITASWNEVRNAIDYMVEIITGGQTVKTYENIAETSLVINGLQPDTEYTIYVKASAGDNISEPAIIETCTEALPFNERQVMTLEATEVTGNSFTANWTPLKDAVRYELNVSRIDYSETPAEETYDFTEGTDGMPVLWESSSDMLSEVEGRYGKSAPSLRMSSDGDYITIAFEDAKIKGLGFWYCSAKENGKIFIETLQDGEWTVTDSITDLKTEGTEVAFTLNDVEKARIRYQRNSGYITIDDITVTVNNIMRLNVPNYNPMTTGNESSANVSPLATDTEYRYTVTAIDNNGNKSAVSKEIKVTTGKIAVTETECDNNEDGDIYTIDGVKLNSITHPGIYIINGKKVFINK